MKYFIVALITFLLLSFYNCASAQNDSLHVDSVIHQQDTSVGPGKTQKNPSKKDSVQTEKSNIFHYAISRIRKAPGDTINQQGLLVTKSEKAYQPYEGKIIRNIIINRYTFEKTFTDTTNSIKYFGTRILNALHNNTKEWVTRNNLFIKEGTPVMATVMADNERFIRSLPYMQDSRIIIQPKTGSPDSVDVYVITKDLFSINFNLNRLSTTRFRGSIEDANLFGIGQRLRFTYAFERPRTPNSGFAVTYTKYNIAHSFVDGSLTYSDIDPDIRNGTNDERIFLLNLQRNLVSQYKHFAGGLTLGDYKTFNIYHQPQFAFYNYHFKLVDVWGGYNLGIRNYLKNKTNPNRQFVSLRYLNMNFIETPEQVAGKLIFRYNDKRAVLGQYTFFRQEFYKTNYLYGFGVTEDVPFGYNVSFTGGWYQQANLSRMYVGVDANRYVVYPKGDIIQYFARAGAFYSKRGYEDVSILAGFSGFSRPFVFSNFKMRQYFRFSYAQIINRTGLEPLSLNNPFGIRNFNRDSVMGNQRISLHSETISFINLKVFGFKFSPFLLADMALILPKLDNPNRSAFYYGIGGGIRMRNENLVFNTIELRFVYFPHTAYGMPPTYGDVNTDVAFRYNTNYVNKPDIIQLNSDIGNYIF